MARLYRPHIPLAIRVAVAERQSATKPNEIWKFYLATGWHPTMHYARRLKQLMQALAMQFGCTVADLRLDHDPPLGARPQERRGLGRKTYYLPDANDPEHLRYRPHGAQFDGSHDTKTRIRGDHGQFSDLALIKRERRRERKKKSAVRKKFKWAKRKFQNRGKKS